MNLPPILIIGTASAVLGGCASHGWAQMQEEFPDVRRNCELEQTELARDPEDKRHLRLIFRQRNAAEIAAQAIGRLACIEHWARERGYTLTTDGV